MSRMEYVDLGSVAKVAVQNYNTYQKRTDFREILMILSILVDTFISKISLPMQPVPEIRSISGA